MAQIQQWFAFLGRVLIGFCFLGLGAAKVASWDYSVKLLQETPLKELLGKEKVVIYLAFTVLVEIIGGFLIVAGCNTRTAAGLLMVIVTASLFYLNPFWKVSDATLLQGYQQFICDSISLGALMLLVSWGPGSIAFDK